MREIKFRAWDSKETQPMWTHEGTLSLLMLQGRVLSGTAEDKDGILERFKIMQFTGLLDKNGKEIYEGDIVRSDIKKEPNCFTTQGVAKVVYSPPHFQLLYPIKFGNYLLFETEHLEVIGNIYENPELLEEIK